MSLTMILILCLIVMGLIAYLGWQRSIKKSKELHKAELKMSQLMKNLELLKGAKEYDEKAELHLQKMDAAIIRARTPDQASAIRSKFVNAAYDKL